MAKETILVVFSTRQAVEDFLDVVESLGGTAQPHERPVAQLSRGDSHVWVYSVEPDEASEEAEVAVQESQLGESPDSEIILEFPVERGSKLLALELIEAAYRRWNLVVDNLHSQDDVSVTVLTMEEVR